jgi:putative N6-adenine-specific DNA methylase
MAEDAPGPAAPGVVFLVGIPGLEDALEAEALRAGFDGVTRVRRRRDRRRAGGGGAGQHGAADGGPGAVARGVVPGDASCATGQAEPQGAVADWLPGLVPVRVEAVCRASRIYHDKAARQRVAGALEAAGIPWPTTAEIAVKVRIEDDLCTVSLDTTGEPLHRRGHKQFVGKAPLRETMAAAFLWQMGFDGTQTVVDPMCGSGTIPLEAAEIAAGLVPGRDRSFAFEAMVGGGAARCPQGSAPVGGGRFFGFDRDQGAIQGAR